MTAPGEVQQAAPRLCETCRYYRQPPAAATVLEGEIAGRFGDAVLSALEQARDVEFQRETAESELESARARMTKANPEGRANYQVWGRRPSRIPYCGVAERDNRGSLVTAYYMANVKNLWQ